MKKRENRVLIALSNEEKETMQEAAKRAGTTVAGVLRRGGLDEARKILGEG